MKKPPAERIRNIALIGHGGSGKTTLAEAMLFAAGAVDRQGKVEDGNTVADWDPEEVRRRISINLALAPVPWREYKVNVIDTPGFFDFAGEVKAALRVVEGALILVDAVSGVEVGTELVSGYAKNAGVARFVVVNKMDRENANFEKALASIEAAFGREAMPLQVPIGAEAGFRGIIDVIDMKALVTTGRDIKEEAVPGNLTVDVEAYRERLVEAAAEADDELTLKYLEGEPLSVEEIRQGLRAAVAQGKIVPVLVASGLKNLGVATLLDAIIDALPAPTTRTYTGTDPRSGTAATRPGREDAALSALVFKTMADPFVGKMTLFRVYSGVFKADTTVYNASKAKSERVGSIYVLKGKTQEAVTEIGAGDIGMVTKLQVSATNDTLCDEAHAISLPEVAFPRPVYAVAVHPRSKGDEEKIGSGLVRLTDEDPSFAVERSTATGENVISGLGDLHVDVMIERLKRKFGVEATTSTPKVAYKEAIRGKAKAEYKHKKQSGGRGQYGHVVIEIEPIEDKDFEFVDKIFAGSVPHQYRPAVEKGVRETMVEGVLAGYHISNIRCTLLDGSYHDVDSSEMAFKLAASMAFKKAMASAQPILLEPIMQADVRVPDHFMGDIIGDLNKKRGRILGMEPTGDGEQLVKAMVPQAEMFKYALDLRSITQGRGSFALAFERYEEVPALIAQPIIAANQKQPAVE